MHKRPPKDRHGDEAQRQLCALCNYVPSKGSDCPAAITGRSLTGRQHGLCQPGRIPHIPGKD